MTYDLHKTGFLRGGPHGAFVLLYTQVDALCVQMINQSET